MEYAFQHRSRGEWSCEALTVIMSVRLCVCDALWSFSVLTEWVVFMLLKDISNQKFKNILFYSSDISKLSNLILV